MLEYLMNKYGVRMNVDELSEELKISINTIREKRSIIRKDLNIYRHGTRLYANSEDVAEYLKKLGSNK